MELMPWQASRLAELQRAYRADIAPLVKIKLACFSAVVPKVIMHQDGSGMTTEYDFPPEVAAVMRLVDEQIRAIRTAYEEMARKL